MLAPIVCHNEKEKGGWEILKRCILKTKKTNPSNSSSRPLQKNNPNLPNLIFKSVIMSNKLYAVFKFLLRAFQNMWSFLAKNII